MPLPTLETHHPEADITAAPARYQRGRLFISKNYKAYKAYKTNESS
jgi:hypothetical protein